MAKKHDKELRTNEKFDRLMASEGWTLLQKSYSLVTRSGYPIHVSVCKGFDRLYIHDIAGPLLVEIKSRVPDVAVGIAKTREILEKYPAIKDHFDVWVVGYKGGPRRYDKRRKDKVWLDRGYFQIYMLATDFAYSERQRVYINV